MLRLITCFILLHILHLGYAQSNIQTFYNLTPELGLTETSVNCVYQDSEDFIWIGTKDGLFRYDGLNFKVYRRIRQDAKTLWNSDVSCIYEDKDSNLWIGTIEGIARYNRDYDYMERVSITYKGEVFREHVQQFIEDSYGNLWVATSIGPMLLNRGSAHVSNPVEGLWVTDEHFPCIRINIDEKGDVWFAYVNNQFGGLLQFDPITKRYRQYSSENSAIGANDITDFTIDENNNFWIAYYNKGVEVFNPDENTLKKYRHNPYNQSTINSDMVHNITIDKNGVVYLGTDDGLSVYDQVSDSFDRYYASSSSNTLLSNIINGIPHCSKENTMWFPCKGGGVSVLDNRYSKFLHLKKNSDSPYSLGHNHVVNFTEDQNNNIWLSTDGGGIFLFNQANNTFKNFKHIPGDPNSLTNNKVLSVMCDNDGGLWAGMWQGGLNYFKVEGENLVLKRKIEKLNTGSELNTSVFTIHKDATGDLWVGTSGDGIYKYSKHDKEFTKITFDPALAGLSVYAIQDDSKGNIWIGAISEGVFRLNEPERNVKHYPYSPEDSTSIAAPTVYSIMEDRTKNLWFGTRGGGLCMFDSTIDGFINYTTADGLPSNKIVGVLEDVNGNIWLSSNNGLAMMNIQALENRKLINIDNYTVSDGLQSSFFNAWAYFQSKNGTLYFGGANGFNSFHPYSIRFNQTPPQIYFTDFLLFNKSVDFNSEEAPLKKDISKTKQILLDHKQSVITFKFNTISFVHNKRCNYAFKLENFEEDWNYVGVQKSATYTNLKPGNYVFRVKASNNDGLWNEKGISIGLVIKPAWWQTTWFILFLTVLVLALLVLIYRLRVAALTKQKERLGVMVKTKTMELQLANKALQQKKSEVEERNELLAVSEEELKQANEELIYTNEELLEQRNELSATIDRLKEAQQQLVESEKMASVGILTSGIAHEINNPLNFIQGGADGLHEFIEDNLKDYAHPLSKFLGMIEEGVSRVTRIISGLNRFNRQTKDYNEDCDIHFVLDNCLLMLQNKIKYNIEVEKQYTQQEISIMGNEGELHQVFLNILANSVDAIEGKGLIEIKTEVRNDTVNIEITDSGIGISEDIMHQLTSPFYTTKPPGKGTGLGLSISSSILSKHGGTMCFDSKPNSGTTVYVSLPLKAKR